MALGHWAKTYLNPNGGGTELPSVTASDNGKVLGVDGGEYKLVEQSGGSIEPTKLTNKSGKSIVFWREGKTAFVKFENFSISAGADVIFNLGEVYDLSPADYPMDLTPYEDNITIGILRAYGGRTYRIIVSKLTTIGGIDYGARFQIGTGSGDEAVAEGLLNGVLAYPLKR